MSNEVTTEHQILLRLIAENLRNCREDLRSMRSFAAATFAIPVAVLVNDAGRSTLSILLSVLTFAAGALVLMPTSVRMITNPATVQSAITRSAASSSDEAVHQLILDEISQVSAAERVCSHRRLIWVGELLLAAGVLLTFVIGRL